MPWACVSGTSQPLASPAVLVISFQASPSPHQGQRKKTNCLQGERESVLALWSTCAHPQLNQYCLIWGTAWFGSGKWSHSSVLGIVENRYGDCMLCACTSSGNKIKLVLLKLSYLSNGSTGKESCFPAEPRAEPRSPVAQFTASFSVCCNWGCCRMP